MTDVEKAQAVIADLEAKRAKLIQRGTDIADERAVLGYGAHAENDKASRDKLNKLNAEAVVLDLVRRAVPAQMDGSPRDRLS